MSDRRPPDRGGASPHILLIGDDDLTAVTQRALRDAGAIVTNLRDPTDPAIRTALGRRVDVAVVISRVDHVSLRSALIVEGVRPGIPLVVTVYDREVASKLQEAVRNVRVVSMADIVAPTIAAACIADDLLSLHRTGDGFRPSGRAPTARGSGRSTCPRRAPSRDCVATRLVPAPAGAQREDPRRGLIGFHAILLLDIVDDDAGAARIVRRRDLHRHTDAGHGRAEPPCRRGPRVVQGLPAATILTGLAFTAVFTAGLVNRLIDRRLVAIAGRRSMPRRDHVVVVGLGQVGLRLSLLLRELGGRSSRSSSTTTPTTSCARRTTGSRS